LGTLPTPLPSSSSHPLIPSRRRIRSLFPLFIFVCWRDRIEDTCVFPPRADCLARFGRIMVLAPNTPWTPSDGIGSTVPANLLPSGRSSPLPQKDRPIRLHSSGFHFFPWIPAYTTPSLFKHPPNVLGLPISFNHPSFFAVACI